MFKLYLQLIVLFTIVSCGNKPATNSDTNSNTEIKNTVSQELKDSIKNELEIELKKEAELELKKKIAEQKRNERLESERQEMCNMMFHGINIQINEIDRLKSELKSASDFQLLRSKSEKDIQIENLLRLIEQYENELSELEEDYNKKCK